MTLELTADQVGIIEALCMDIMHCPEWPNLREHWEADVLAILAMLDKEGRMTC